MTRVAFDLTAAAIDRGGSGVHARMLAAALDHRADVALARLAFPWSRVPSPRRTVGDQLRTLGRDLWWAQRGVVSAARRAGADILHLPVPIGPIRCALPLVVTVHDLFVLTSPERFRTWMRTSMAITVPRLLRRADAIIASSEATRRTIVEVLDLPEERITVIGIGAASAFGHATVEATSAIRQRYALPARYLLAVGQIEPRKNLPNLIRAAVEARRQVEASDLTIVHAGAAGWLGDDVTAAMQRPGARDAVRFLGYLPVDELAALYAGAEGLVFPSHDEGFGIPLVEAMASDIPIITSPLSSLPEVAGPAALYAQPTDVAALSLAMIRLWTDGDLRHSLRTAGRERKKLFAWDAIAASTAQVYQRVLA